MSDFFANSVAPKFVEFIVLYWVHSSILLILTWVTTRYIRRLSAAFMQRTWQFACTAGIVTASLHLIGWQSSWSATLQDSSTPNSSQTNERRLAYGTQDSDTIRRNDLPIINSESTINSQPVFDNENRSLPGIRNQPVFIFQNNADKGEPENVPKSSVQKPQKVIPKEALKTSQDPVHSIVLRGAPEIPVEEPISTSVVSQSQTGSGNQQHPSKFSLGLPTNYAVWIASIALAWIAIGLTIVLTQLINLARQSKSFVPCNNARLNKLFDRLLLSRKIKTPIQLLQCDRIGQPIACGWFRKKIVLNPLVADQLTDQEIEGLLAHEIAHHVRGDWLWLVVGKLFCTCLAIQPLNFLARKRWQDAGEEACDQWAVRSGIEPISLARCLTKVAEWQNSNRISISLAASGSSSVVLRVESLLQNDTHMKSLGLKSVMMVSILVGALAGTALTPAPEIFAPSAQVVEMPEQGEELASNAETAVPAISAEPENAKAMTSDAVEDSNQIQDEPDLLRQWNKLDQEIHELSSLLRYAESIAPDKQPEITQLIEGLKSRFQSLDSRRQKILNQLNSNE